MAIVAVAMTAVLTQLQQQNADARGCTKSIAVNASKGKCFKGETQEADESNNDDEEED